MKTDIVVIGGYGHVGSQICRLLGAEHPGKVYAAGRNLQRAESFSRSTGGQVKPLRLAAEEPLSQQLLERTKLVVMCLDQQDTRLAAACLQSGTHYVDVSASGEFLQQVQLLAPVKNHLRAAAVLSVGLAPGLTNLLAAKAVQELDRAELIDISIMLGLGDSHGQAALEWTVDQLGSAFEITEHGKLRNVSSFRDGKSTEFGFSLRKRTAYRFPFSDQQTLPATLNVPSISTRLCFDSRTATAAVALLRSLGLPALLRIKAFRNLAVKAFGKFRIGSEQYAVKVDAYGTQAGSPVQIEYGIEGVHEAAVTAVTAAGVALHIYNAPPEPGVYHIEQLFSLQSDGQRLLLAASDKGQPGSSKAYPLEGLRFWTRTGSGSSSE
ncbi:saccharopine dehydrogenase NADP-binding domain-containing protein [Paenibacillus sp. MMS20-IR301]|uniref:saccharopine dehydrogenase family protein n=1 Tax=Paenibacillus sp. MMS20-IR301 TaxID=2895946 RepID=UPI0028E9E5D3|nr:saccharopine dehydrogenase NADP-binding domain-containing protein [Paenibacillus sp. MMS20-IR301]WNS45992.1 saccharopine dehydrogenase NADP-binding domain-containing protein [Paenibacillus sp. MMS20-IR301]